MRIKEGDGSGEKAELAIHRLKKERKDQVGQPKSHPVLLLASNPTANHQQVYPHGSKIIQDLPSPPPLPLPPPAWSLTSNCPSASSLASLQSVLHATARAFFPECQEVTQKTLQYSHAFGIKWHRQLTSSGPYPPLQPHPLYSPHDSQRSSHSGFLIPTAGPSHTLPPLPRESLP